MAAVKADSSPFIGKKTESLIDESTENSPVFDLPKYKVRPYGRKLALIVSISQFSALPRRPSSAVDDDVIKLMLEESLGFQVLLKQNYTALQLTEMFWEMSTWDYEDVDMLAIVIMSYGDNREILAADGVKVNINDLLDHLKGSNCQSLAGKPKMIIINAGPWEEVPEEMFGGMVETDACIESKTIVEDQKICIPQECDFIYIYSPVTFGHQRCGQVQQGNIFLSALSETCLRNKHLEVCQLLTETNQQVALQVLIGSRVPARPCFFMSTLTKELYLSGEQY